MSQPSDMFEFRFRENEKILIGKIILGSMEKDQAAQIYDYVAAEQKNQPAYDHFILDALNVTKVTNPAIGFLMKSLGLVKKTKGYMILVISEALLQGIMLSHPQMFDFYAVFHSIEDAVAYTKK
ncbi:MAG TPA: hypothetical protein P5346_13215 [Spirochaetota bacterium]|nr:hypothetical protein [Spirochaetota bacterium]